MHRETTQVLDQLGIYPALFLLVCFGMGGRGGQKHVRALEKKHNAITATKTTTRHHDTTVRVMLVGDMVTWSLKYEYPPLVTILSPSYTSILPTAYTG